MEERPVRVIQGAQTPLYVKKKKASEKCLQEDQLKKTGMQLRLRACSVLPVAGVHEPVAKNVDGRGCQSAKDTQSGEASALCKQQVLSQL